MNQKTSLTKIKVLKRLAACTDKIVSSSSLIQDIGISRQSIWKAIESLKEEGFRIESLPHKGYRLAGMNNYDMAPTWIGLNTSEDENWGKDIHVLDSIDSTQLMAKELARKHCSDGTAILSEKQTQGKGRMDRTWDSPYGTNIYMSVIFFPLMAPSMLQLINLAAGVAIISSIRKVTGLECQLKWPNDVIFNEKKICGILSEASIELDRIHFVTTGMGINVNMEQDTFPETIRAKAGSIMDLTGNRTDRGKLAGVIISQFHSQIKDLVNNGPGNLLNSYIDNCSTLGRDVEILTGRDTFRGQAIDITPRGEIVVIVKGREMTFSAADIIHAPHR